MKDELHVLSGLEHPRSLSDTQHAKRILLDGLKVTLLVDRRNFISRRCDFFTVVLDHFYVPERLETHHGIDKFSGSV